jgi:hypothetical protein
MTGWPRPPATAVGGLRAAETSWPGVVACGNGTTAAGLLLLLLRARVRRMRGQGPVASPLLPVCIAAAAAAWPNPCWADGLAACCCCSCCSWRCLPLLLLLLFWGYLQTAGACYIAHSWPPISSY